MNNYLPDMNAARIKAPNNLQPAESLLEAICPIDGAFQHYYFQQEEAIMGAWVSGEEAAIHSLGKEQFEIAFSCTAALGHSGC